MTFEEFKSKLKLRYTYGESRTDGASRRYHDPAMNIGGELHTPRNEYGEWGKGERFYYMEEDRRTFSTLEELYEAYNE